MWVHPNDTQKDVQAEIKEAVFHGASCLLRTIFEEYEAFESEANFSVDLITEANLAQRAIFAGETFLMIFDPAYSVPKKAMHEAFVVEFLMHTVSHIADEIEQSTFELRKDMFRVIRKVLKHTEVEYYFESNVEEWQEDFSWIAAELVGNFDFEYSSMLNRLDELGASFVGKIFADLNLKDPNYFDGYSSSYIEKNMNQIVSKCAKIIDFIEKYQKSGNFRPHP
ncbi:MAG: hypothetical protein CMA57_00525 [Euryarchaeota archaeon]|nr:hypothetical protein [Euryarchaeota archaeon]